jgi:hypothetical protein
MVGFERHRLKIQMFADQQRAENRFPNVGGESGPRLSPDSLDKDMPESIGITKAYLCTIRQDRPVPPSGKHAVHGKQPV